VSGLSDVVDISVGGENSCALLSDGSVKCWGYNNLGLLGNNSTTSSTTPLAVSGLTGAVAISAGGGHSCALLGNGAVNCWGWNGYGQLGNNSTISSSIPVSAIGFGMPQTLIHVPEVVGLAVVGSTLTAFPGVWDAGVDLSYQWFIGEVAAPGAQAPSFTVPTSALGSIISVVVTGSKPGFSPITKTSIQTGEVLRAIPVASVPKITGTLKVGSTLTLNRGTWSNGVAFSYQWLADGEVIAGATATSYELTNAQAGKQISVRVVGSLAGYGSTSKQSLASAIVTGGTITTFAKPNVSGVVAQGHTLTAGVSGWADGVSFAYKWVRGTSTTVGTAASYVIQPADAGQTITLTVTGSKTGFNSLSQSSAKTIAVPFKTISLSSVPVITGTVSRGKTVSVTAGAWSEGVTLKYQWLLDGKAVSKATKSTFKIPTTARGKKLTVRVTGSIPGYSAVAKTSVYKKIG
jgi:hypothetical protein